jgi:DNA-binding response OmpR family regulator
VPLLDQLDHLKMNAKILLVEDKQELGMILSEQLASEGYAVEVASDTQRVFDRASAKQCDLIILDPTLSGRSRIELCRDIWEAGLTNPVLVPTPRGQTAHWVVSLKLGADDCIGGAIRDPGIPGPR